MDQQFSSSPSSSSSQYKDLLHRWDDDTQHQPRDWLSSSASPSTRIENHDDDDNYVLGRGRGGLGRGGVGGVGGGSSSTSYGVIEREHMFDKVVTPSDVGKLNRLVIPKQHAEKYFPLDTSTSSSNNNSNNNNNENKTGLLLNFEDRTGKSWRFRYSYWNSSQSYVMTKGWSRFVKEKQLSAGDIVSFQRGVGDEIARQTFYIDWRRRPPQHDHYNHHHHHHLGTAFAVHHSVPGWTTTPTLYLRSHPYPSPNVPIWDRFSTNSTTHLSSISGNVVNMVPYGSSGSNVVNNPQYLANHNAGSLIFLRSSSFSSTSSSIPSINPSTLPSLALSSDGHHGWGVSNEPKVYESVPLVQVRPPSGGGVGGAAAKRSLRLFGVNMDCSSSEHHQDVEIEDGQVSSMGTCTKSAPSSTTLNFDLDPK